MFGIIDDHQLPLLAVSLKLLHSNSTDILLTSLHNCNSKATTMPRNPNKPVWSATGDHAAQLFRDIYFNKYPVGTPPSVVFEDPDRPYSKYSKEGFYKQYKSSIEKVNTFRTFGTGLKETFRAKCRLNNLPTEEERGAVFGTDQLSDVYNSEEDEDYNDTGSQGEDITLAGFEVESLLGNLEIEDKKKPKKARKKKNENNNRELLELLIMSDSLISPRLTECSGGNIAGTVPLLTGFDYELTIAENCRDIMQKVYVPDTYLDAKKLFNRHGLNEQNVFVAGVQADINKQKKKTKTNEMGKHYIENVLFSLDYEVEHSFYDGQGNKENKIFEGKGPGGIRWAFFYLKKKEFESLKSPPAKIDRDNRRVRDGDDGVGYTRNVAPNTANWNSSLPNTNGWNSNQQQFHVNGFNVNPNGFQGLQQHQQFQGQVPVLPGQQMVHNQQFQQQQHHYMPQQGSPAAAGNGWTANHPLPNSTAGGHNQWMQNGQHISARNPPVQHFVQQSNNVVHQPAPRANNIQVAHAAYAANGAPFHATGGTNTSNNNNVRGNNIPNNNGDNRNVRIVRNPEEVARLVGVRALPNAYVVDPNDPRSLVGPSPITVDDILDDGSTSF